MEHPLQSASRTFSQTTSTTNLPAIGIDRPAQLSSPHPHNAVTNRGTVENIYPGHLAGGRRRCDHHPAAGPDLRDCPGWQPRQALRRPQGPRPHLPEPLRPLSSRLEARKEDGRLAQDEGDHLEGTRLDHRRGQGIRIERKRWCWIPLGSEMGRERSPILQCYLN